MAQRRRRHRVPQRRRSPSANLRSRLSKHNGSPSHHDGRDDDKSSSRGSLHAHENRRRHRRRRSSSSSSRNRSRSRSRSSSNGRRRRCRPRHGTPQQAPRSSDVDGKSHNASSRNLRDVQRREGGELSGNERRDDRHAGRRGVLGLHQEGGFSKAFEHDTRSTLNVPSQHCLPSQPTSFSGALPTTSSSVALPLAHAQEKQRTPPVPVLKVESVEERRLLARSYPSSTSSVLGNAHHLPPVLPDAEDTGVLGEGAQGAQISLANTSAQRPPTPSLIPAYAGHVSSTSTSPVPLLPTRTVPFSFDEYVTWLNGPSSAEKIAERNSTMSDSTRHQRRGTTASLTSARNNSNDDRESQAAPNSTAASQHSLHHSTGAAQKQEPPLSLSSLHSGRTQTPSVARSPPAPEEVSYERQFAVSTDLEAALSAPPIMRQTPLCLQQRAVVEAFARSRIDERDKTTMPADSFQHGAVSRSSAVSSSNIVAPPALATSAHIAKGVLDSLSERQSSIDATDMPTETLLQAENVQRGVLDSSPPRADSSVEPSLLLSTTDAESESARAFVQHFQHGKVHTRPPWYLCATLLDNCEHPHYTNWLDELDLGTAEEELARARGKGGSVLGDL